MHQAFSPFVRWWRFPRALPLAGMDAGHLALSGFRYTFSGITRLQQTRKRALRRLGIDAYLSFATHDAKTNTTVWLRGIGGVPASVRCADPAKRTLDSTLRRGVGPCGEDPGAAEGTVETLRTRRPAARPNRAKVCQSDPGHEILRGNHNALIRGSFRFHKLMHISNDTAPQYGTQLGRSRACGRRAAK